MKQRLFATLAATVIGPLAGFAQAPVPSPSPEPVILMAPAPTSAGGSLWGSADYLGWWLKAGSVPTLLTTGTGPIGAPGTQVLVDNLDFVDRFRSGGRLAVGGNLAACPTVGVEASYFFLGDGHGERTFTSDAGGAPVLARPYVNAANGQQAATFISTPGIANGFITFGASTSLWGAEANVLVGLRQTELWHLNALLGLRCLTLEDELNIHEQFFVFPDVPGFGGSTVTTVESFQIDNRFYGGQVGIEAGFTLGRCTVDLRAKLALGQMQETAYLNGVTNVLSAQGDLSILQGGLVALHSNIGRFRRDEFAVVPEVGINVGLQVTDHVQVRAGSSLLWISSLLRAGKQIDPVINETQFPILGGSGPVSGPARPAFNFHATDFWAQGFSVGVELTW